MNDLFSCLSKACEYIAAPLAAPALQNHPDELYSLSMQQPAQGVFPVAAPVMAIHCSKVQVLLWEHTHFEGKNAILEVVCIPTAQKKQPEKALLSSAALDVNNKVENSHRYKYAQFHVSDDAFDRDSCLLDHQCIPQDRYDDKADRIAYEPTKKGR
ncbi:hypothetical protein NECAME_16126 [Necator americanus]|uniref:Uncharacterized protein n=1 Tax=Necator americanus TaxID=51031 RepID=W2U0H0_NECAM|nr:hypothetical protein NECAME_16126 [Necator americanus]ETN86782.1 hypothetical protein NECAME_16126 [Necator americanus]